MTHVFHRHTQSSYPIAVGGEGPYLIDSQGRRYLDASGGAAVSCLGHSDPDVIAAIQKPHFSPPSRWSNWLTT